MRFVKSVNIQFTVKELNILTQAMDLLRIVRDNCEDPEWSEIAANGINYLVQIYDKANIYKEGE